MIKHALYDIAVAEVRGEASPADKKKLQANVFAWREALQSVVDEVDAQLVTKSPEFEDRIADAEKSGVQADIDDAHHTYDIWKTRALTFKKHVYARLLAVKRMCQDAAEITEGQNIDLEKAMAVVSAAIVLQDADEGLEALDFDATLDALFEAVNEYVESLG